MPHPMALHYFAYGSNLHPGRLLARVPSAQPLRTARLHGHQLHFHKRSVDGSGKCNAHYTGDPRHVIHGVVYRIDAHHRTELDRCEQGYDIHYLNVHHRRGQLEVFTYIAPAHRLDPSLKPYPWYQRFVVDGARHHGLPAHYIDTLSEHPSQTDPDPQRSSINLALLTAPATR